MIRDRFAREKKRFDKQTAGESDPEPPKWSLWEHVSFLRGMVKSRKYVVEQHCTLHYNTQSCGCGALVLHEKNHDSRLISRAHLFFPRNVRICEGGGGTGLVKVVYNARMLYCAFLFPAITCRYTGELDYRADCICIL